MMTRETSCSHFLNSGYSWLRVLRMGLPLLKTIGYLGVSLLSTTIVHAQTIELPAVIRCQMDAESHPDRNRLISQWIQRAGKNDAVAALCLSFSPNPRQDQSLAWLRQAADLGLPDAQLLLGADLETGVKSRLDHQEAMTWYHKAADADFPFAQYELASIYSESRAAQQKNLPEAYYWARLAARHQFLPAKALVDQLKTQLSSEERRQIEARLKKWKRVVS